MPIKSHQVQYDGADGNCGSSKQLKQLHYYGPEFLKLLVLSYASETHLTIPTPPSHHENSPHYPNNDDNYNGNKEYNKHGTKDDKRGPVEDNKTKEKKKKGRPNQGHNRFSQPAYSLCRIHYNPYI